MKKVLLLAAFQLLTMAAMAVPAHPQQVVVQQPDGSKVTVQLHGDEWLHFTTTDDGYSVVKDQRGYYVYARLQDGKLQPTSQTAHDAQQRTAAEKAFLTGVQKMLAPQMDAGQAALKEQVQQRQRQTLASHRATDYDKFRGLIILVQFNDLEFSREDYPTLVNDMVNKKGYTGFGDEVYTGSVHDYFSDNSGGKFQPQFDIIGPVTVDYSQYDPHGTSNAHSIAAAAIDAADDEVDFSQYDGDGNGTVDLVYFIIAGNGANYSGNDSRLWWPHRSTLSMTKDGKSICDYASSVELYGWTDRPGTVQIDGIGTICHEFSHVLGLPDFYDADYASGGGQSDDPGNWSVMAAGCYLNKARTPTGYSLYERYSVGFCDVPEVIAADGSYTLGPLYLNMKGYMLLSTVANECFLLENRQKEAYKWDSYLPGSGMLVHRLDKTSTSPWNANRVNANPAHNYYEVVRADGVHYNKKGAHQETASDLFPGDAGVTELNNLTTPASLKTWGGKETPFGLSDIRMQDGMVTFMAYDTVKKEDDHDGDANGDGVITISDAVSIVNFILRQPSSGFTRRLSDVNSDGKVTITDAVGVVNIILNDN